MVNLKVLERSLAKIEEVGKDELVFEANGTSIVFRTLLSGEEEIVDAFARLAYTAPLSEFDIPDSDLEKASKDAEDEDEDKVDPFAIVRHRIWLDRLRQATLGFVIVELDGQDLRGVQYIETGEVDENGNAVSVIKHEALRDLVSRWTRPVLTQMFGAYSELMDRINLKASKLVQFKPADIDEELKRLRFRMLELEKHKMLSNDPAMRTKHEQTEQTVAGSVNATTQGQMQKLANLSEAETEEKAQEQVQAQKQQPRTPQTQRLAQPPLPAEPEPEQTTAPPPPPSPQYPPGYIPPPFEGDSRFDPADPDEALAAENVRQEILYRQQQERIRQQKEAGDAPKTIIQGQAVRPQVAPKGAVSLGGPGELREALNTSHVAAQTMDPSQTQTPVRQGTKRQGGKEIPIYKQPTTTLERRGPRADPSEIQIDPSTTSRNPRFKPANED